MSASVSPVAKLYPIMLTKALANEVSMKLEAILSDWEDTEGSYGSEDDFTTLADKMEVHRHTSCRKPIMLTAYEIDTVAEELDNSAEINDDNGYKTVARRMYDAAKAMREVVSSIH